MDFYARKMYYHVLTVNSWFFGSIENITVNFTVLHFRLNEIHTFEFICIETLQNWLRVFPQTKRDEATKI